MEGVCLYIHSAALTCKEKQMKRVSITEIVLFLLIIGIGAVVWLRASEMKKEWDQIEKEAVPAYIASFKEVSRPVEVSCKAINLNAVCQAKILHPEPQVWLIRCDRKKKECSRQATLTYEFLNRIFAAPDRSCLELADGSVRGISVGDGGKIRRWIHNQPDFGWGGAHFERDVGISEIMFAAKINRIIAPREPDWVACIAKLNRQGLEGRRCHPS